MSEDNSKTGSNIELNVDEVKRKQRAKHYEHPNPIVDSKTSGGEKMEQLDIEDEVSYPFEQEQADKPKEKKPAQKSTVEEINDTK